MLFTISAFLVI